MKKLKEIKKKIFRNQFKILDSDYDACLDGKVFGICRPGENQEMLVNRHKKFM